MDLDTAKAKATCKNGVLEIIIPKKDEAKLAEMKVNISEPPRRQAIPLPSLKPLILNSTLSLKSQHSSLPVVPSHPYGIMSAPVRVISGADKEEAVSNREEIDADSLEGSLSAYKGKIAPINKGTLTWDKDLIFLGRTQRGYELDFDAQAQWGCIPTESLLMSVAGCLAIDCISFLQKMKCVITKFKIDIAGERNPVPPQYYKKIEMVIHVAGEHITPKKMDRVISLSQEKYCSVYHSLRKDIAVKVTYEIE